MEDGEMGVEQDEEPKGTPSFPAWIDQKIHNLDEHQNQDEMHGKSATGVEKHDPGLL